MLRLTLALLLALAAPPARAQADTRPGLEGVVTHITDGDTVWVRPDAEVGKSARRKPVKIRLVGLDAPERCQAHGLVAAEALESLALQQRAQVRLRTTDTHGRTLATLWIDGFDVGARLVREGHAWSARYRGNPGPYAREEAEARAARRGLFAAVAPEWPGSFRRRHGACS